MAKFTPGAIISEIRGSIAATTYSRSRAGAIVKAKLIQTNPNTPAQQAIRALTAAAVAAWQSATQSVQDEWIAFAATQRSKPRIDGTHKLSGYNSWIRFFVVRNKYGLSGNPIPAPQKPTGSYSNMSFSSTAATLDFTIDGNNTNPDVFAVFRLSDGVSQGINSINPSMQKFTNQELAPAGSLNLNIAAFWETIFGPLDNASNKKIFLRVDIVNRLTAQIVTIFRGSTIIPPQVQIVAVSETGNLDRAMNSLNAVDWVSAVTPNDNNWGGVAYSPALKLFCAVAWSGTGDRVMTSPDGINWTLRASATDQFWFCIAWSPDLNLFCALSFDGGNSQVMTSPDGINWTLRNNPVTATWRKLVWSPGLGLFCAVAQSGASGATMTSPDGIVWTSSNSAPSNDYRGIAWSPSLSIFCAVSSGGGTQQAITSPDGINWTLRNTPDNLVWRDVAWSPVLNLFCAVADGFDLESLMTSPDGINWTLRSGFLFFAPTTIVWSTNLSLFVVSSRTVTTDQIMTSPDGINWTRRTTTGGNDWTSLASRD